MQTIELFCGTKSFSEIAASNDFSTLTVDNNPKFSPDICADIYAMPIEMVPKNGTILWASPPCEAFSVAAIGKNWHPSGEPKHLRAVIAQFLVLKTLEIIQSPTPAWWFIENPRGKRLPPVSTALSGFGRSSILRAVFDWLQQVGTCRRWRIWKRAVGSDGAGDGRRR